MKWTVVFSDEAETDLAGIFLASQAKESITFAANRIEQELKNDPDRKGEDYFGDRLLKSGPLVVAYELFSDDLLVRVIQVLHIRES